jgi:microcompartment protein CcmL/EutN
MADRALGMVETRGLVASIEAADAMVKAARVKLIGKEKVQGGLITILVVGETAAVKSAVDAGAVAAQRVGELISTHIIPRPDDQIDEVVEGIKSSEEKSVEELPVQSKKKPERIRRKAKIKEKEDEPEEKSPSDDTTSSTLDRLKREALGEATDEVKEARPTTSRTESTYSMQDLEVMNVHQLRRFARDFEEFPIKGREISRANRGELLDFFKALLK